MNNESTGGGQQYLVADYYDDSKRWRLAVNAGRVTAMQPASADETQQPQGFVHFIDASRRKTLIGYYSIDRIASDDAPDYARSLFVVVDDMVYGGAGDTPHLRQSHGMQTRALEVRAAGSKAAVVEYVWPFYRELPARLFAEPSSFVSRDFIGELMRTVRFYRPDWVSSRWMRTAA